MQRSRLAFFYLAIGGCVVATNVAARPLDIESCDRLLQQEATLEQAGVRGYLQKGPAWAKANLSADRIEQVRQLIEVEESIAFRCRNPKPLPPESVNAQPVVAAVAAKPKPKVKQVVAAKDAAVEGAPAAAPKPKPKPPAKAPAAKPADSYTAAAPKTEN